MADDTLYNYLSDVKKNFGDVAASFTEVVDLQELYMFRALQIFSTLNEPVKIRFYNPVSATWSELYIPSRGSGVSFGQSLDNFHHNGVIELKYIVDAPTEGFIKITSWRAE